MTILDKIRKARELVAAMDAAKGQGTSAEWIRCAYAAEVAAFALIRDDELLALVGEVERLREDLAAANELGPVLIRERNAERKRAEAAEAERDLIRERHLTQAQTIMDLQAKLAAAEVDARRWRKLVDPGTSFTITVNGGMLTAAADAAMQGEG